MLFEELDERETYDGIWACASILHVKKEKLPGVLKRIANAAKKNGTIYVSFKYGDFEGMKAGRYFTYLTEESFGELIRGIPELVIEKLWVSGDVRAGRGDEMWLNMILGKDDVGYCKIV
jgi:hypothetical protein